MDVYFYSGDQLLGMIHLVGPGHLFAGWQSKAKAKPIPRIQVEDLVGGKVIVIDGVVYSIKPLNSHGPKPR